MKIIIIYFFLFSFWVTNTIGFSLTGVKGLSLENFSLYLLFVVWAFNIIRKRKVLEWCSLNTYLLIFIFVVILSIPHKIMLNELPGISLKQEIIALKNWIEPLIVFFVMFNILEDKKSCNMSLVGLGILLLVTALGSPLTLFKIAHVGRVAASTRASGFSGDTNEFAAYLVLFIPLVLTVTLFHNNKTLRAYGAVTLFSTFLALIFSGSRGGILSCAVSVSGFLYLLFSQNILRLRTLLSVTVIVLMICTVSFVMVPSGIKETVLYRLDPSRSESAEDFSSGRLDIWSRSLSLFAEKPLFGHGLHSIMEIYYLRFGVGKVAHNQYLNYLVELGVIGCLLFILIFLKLFRLIWNFIKDSQDLWDKKLYIGYIAGLLGYTSSMLFVNLTQPRSIFWFYTAVFLRYGQLQESGDDSSVATT